MRTFAVTVLLVAALCCASAARIAPDTFGIDELKPSAANVQSWIASNKGKEHHKAYMAFRYYVEPEERKGFLDAWAKLEGSTKDESDVLIYDLKKPMSDNVMYVGYGEWKSFKSYMEHLESDYVQDFIHELNKLDIEFTIVPLVRPDVSELHPEKEQKEEKQLAHVIIHYHVPPSAHQEFLDAWNAAEQGTEGEKGAHIYALRKVFEDNHNYIAYGTWDSMQDYQDHFESGHVKDLRRTLDKHGIVWHLAPLYKVGSQPE